LGSLPANWTNIGDWSQFRWSPQADTLIAITEATNQPDNLRIVPANSTARATLTLWNTQNGKLKAILAAKARDIKAAYSVDGHAVVALIDGKPRGWDMSGTPINIVALPALPRGIKELCPRVLTRQGEIMRALQKGKTVFLERREVLTGKLTRHEFPLPFNSKAFAPRALFVAPDGSSVAVKQANGMLALWNLHEWKLLGHVKLPSPENVVASPAPGGHLVAVAAPDGAIHICNPQVSSSLLTLQVLPSRQPRRGGQDWAVFSPDGFYHASPQAPRQLKRLSNGQMLLFFS
jgi:WD40 repeat protein